MYIIKFLFARKRNFLKNLVNSKIFNEPLKNIIFKTNAMNNKDILLILGSSGTGKTHIITGLISFLALNNDNKSKILVCIREIFFRKYLLAKNIKKIMMI